MDQAEPPPEVPVRTVGPGHARAVVVAAIAVLAVVMAVVAAIVVWAVDGTGTRGGEGQAPGSVRASPPVESATAPPGWRWTEPPRPRTRQMVATETHEIGDAGSVTLEDGLDADGAWVDIEVVSATRDPRWDDRWSWTLELGEVPPPVGDVGASRRSVAYGLVVDGDGDLEADCMIGLDDDAPVRGHFRVWVTDVGTGTTVVRDHPPYGRPIEFLHPDEVGARTVFDEPTVLFAFPEVGAPCERFGPWASFYAWASDAVTGRGSTWDFAPDDAWLPMP